MKVLIFEAYTDANIGSGALIENSSVIENAASERHVTDLAIVFIFQLK